MISFLCLEYNKYWGIGGSWHSISDEIRCSFES